MHIHHGLYSGVPQGQYNPWMALDQFSSYVAWPEDRPTFLGKVEQHLQEQGYPNCSKRGGSRSRTLGCII